MKSLFAVSFFVVFFIGANAQDNPLSQPYSNPFWMCPALTGNSDAPRISSFVRDQWPSLGGSYVTCMAGFDAQVEKVHGGLGAYVIYDRAGEGTLIEWSFNGVYSYSGKINDNLTLRGGTQLTLGNKHLNTDKLIFPDQIDPCHGFVFNTNQTFPEDGLNKTYFDLALSASADFRKFTFGVSCFHLNSPDIGFMSESRLPRRLAGFVGYDLWLLKGETPEGLRFSPLLYVTTLPGGFSAMAGTNVSWNWLYCGAYYRFNESNADALAFQAGARFWHFQAGYSYDMTVSKLTNASGGSHELFLNYYFKKK